MPSISLVIPVCNERGNIAPLVQEIDGVLAGVPACTDYEIVFVDDGSTDGSAEEITALASPERRLRLLAHGTRLGVSAAFRTGIRAATADWIVTLDGDGQNDPADIPRLLQLAWSRLDNGGTLVCGVRVNRRDTWQKRLASKAANAIRRAVLHDGAPDTACALKVFPRTSWLELPFFNGLHRFLPALFHAYGHEVLHTPVNDRLRLHGRSKSDILGRGVRGFFDLFGVAWLIRRTPKAQKVTEYSRPAS